MKKALKISALLMAFVLVIAGTVGVTLALLSDKTGSITNTFTVGKVDIELTETKGEANGANGFKFSIVPGVDIEKDPVVTVKAGSEDCYVFVKLAGLKALDDADTANRLTYALTGWTKLADDVYYRTVTKANTDTPLHVFENDTITVSSDLTNAELQALAGKEIVITAYAVQQQKDASTNLTVDEAWDAAQKAEEYTAA